MLTLLALRLLAASSCTAAPTSTASAPEPGPTATVPAPVLHDVTFENVDGLVVVPARVEGIARELHFVLDTGAPSVLRDAVAAELGLSGGTRIEAADAAGKTVEVTPVVLPELRVGELQMNGVAGLIAPLPSFDILCHPIDGILGVGLAPGSGFLDRVAVEIDYSRRRLRFADRGTSLRDGGTSVPLRRMHVDESGNQVVGTSSEVEVVAEGKRGWASLDSGSRGVVSMSAGLFTSLGRSLDEPGLVERHGVMRQTVTGLQTGVRREGRLHSLEIGGLRFSEIPLAVEDDTDPAFARLLLSSELLRHFTVIVDYPGRELRLIPQPESDPRVRRPELGVQWLDVDGRVSVVSLLTDGAAERAGVALGDEVLEVAGVAVATGDHPSLCEARRRVDVAAGEPIHMQLRRSQRVFEVHVSKEALATRSR